MEFLDSVLESTRAQEAAVKKQTREQLEAFKRQQEELEQAAKGSAEPEEKVIAEKWTVSRKRKKGQEDVLGGVKLRKASSGGKATTSSEKAEVLEKESSEPATAMKTETAHKIPEDEGTVQSQQKGKDAAKPSKSPSPGVALGLAGYSSDEDD